MKKKILYISIISLTLVLLVLIFFAINYFNRKATVVINNVPEVSNEIKKADLKLSRQNDIDNYNKAQEAQDINTCSLVIDKPYKDLCIQEIAIKAKASTSCSGISNEDTRSYCSSVIALNKAEESKLISDCLAIEQSMLKKTCVERLAETAKIADCEPIANSDLKNTCLSIIYYFQAKLDNSVKICNQIPELIRRANCLSEVQNIDLHSDLDRDGLDYLQEILSGTNPSNPDTDGDGYKDGDEIQGGFNPDGAGLISEVKPSNIVSCADIKDEITRLICSHEFKGGSFDILKCNDIKDLKLKKYCTDSNNSLNPINK